MKILLVVPTFKYKQAYPAYLSISDFPSGLAYIAAALKKAGHEVVGLNLNNDSNHSSAKDMITYRIKEALSEPFDLIGLGGLCIDYSFIKDALEVMRDCTFTPIVLGGGIMRDGDFIFNNLKPDYGIKHEGEEAMVRLADALELGEGVSHIDNLYYWDDNTPKFTKEDYEYGDIDSRAFPDYDVFGAKDMIDNYSMITRLTYRYPRYRPRPMIITTARSCPFNCSFCVHSGGPKYRVRSFSNIMDEIKQLYDKYHFNILIIIDELFVPNKYKVREFCEVLSFYKKKYGWDFTWTFQTHASANLDKESLELLKKAGCFMFSYGIESASPIILKSMNKKTDISQTIEAIRLSQEVGIGFCGNLLFGDPAETVETAKETLNFFLEYCMHVSVFFGALEAYPGCQLFDRCMEKGFFRDRESYYADLGKYRYNFTGMSNRDYVDYNAIISEAALTWDMVDAVDGLAEIDSLKSVIPKYKIYRITATCPSCKKEGVYSEEGRTIPIYFGTGCQHCGRKIKINLLREIIRHYPYKTEAV